MLANTDIVEDVSGELARLEIVKQDRSIAWREVRGLVEAENPSRVKRLALLMSARPLAEGVRLYQKSRTVTGAPDLNEDLLRH